MQKIILEIKYGWYFTFLTFKCWKRLVFSELDISQKNLVSWIFWDSLRHYTYKNQFQSFGYNKNGSKKSNR